MTFLILTLLSAFLLETLGTTVSVIGLSSLFGSSPIIVALIISLDFGKLVVVSLVYKLWKKKGPFAFIMKYVGLFMCIALMLISSWGIGGYLSAEFQKGFSNKQENEAKVAILDQEVAKLDARKAEIQKQITSIPERSSVNLRIKMMGEFKTEQEKIDTRLDEINKTLPTLKIGQIEKDAKAGPIIFISKAFNTTVEEAVKYVILLIVFVFDPLAVYLVVAANEMMAWRKKEKDEEKLNKSNSVALAPIAVEETKQTIAAEEKEEVLIAEPIAEEIIVEQPVKEEIIEEVVPEPEAISVKKPIDEISRESLIHKPKQINDPTTISRESINRKSVVKQKDVKY